MIRKSRAQDSAAIYALVCEMEGRELPADAFRAIYLRQLESADCLCLIYEAEGEAAGFINLRFEAQLHHAERVAEIMELAVRADRRSGGIGRQLVEAACRAAQENGCGRIEVACNQLRHDTHRFYSHCGMGNTHFKFTMSFNPAENGENRLGR